MQPDFSEIDKYLHDTFISKLIPELSEIYLVGGSLRDLLFGQAIVDYDFVVLEKDIDKISSYLDSISVTHFFLASGRTRLLRAVNSGVEFDFMVINNAIENEIKLRDFTINTIYYSLKDHAIYSDSMAFSDLEHHILRAVSSSSITDDPVRVFRGIRFASFYNLSIEEDTRLLLKDAVKLINKVTKERAREEIKKIFQCDFKRTIGVLENVFGFKAPDIIERNNEINTCKALESSVNKNVSYSTLVHIALLERVLPIFAFAFSGLERRIIDDVLSSVNYTAFESLFECFLSTDARVLMGSLIINLPLNKAGKFCRIVESWSNVRVKGDEIKKASYDFGITLKEARIDILKEKCKKIYDEV
jgi:hypothetical protein